MIISFRIYIHIYYVVCVVWSYSRSYTHTRSDDADGDGLNSRLYIYPRYWNLYVLIFISYTHINARSEDTFCVCYLFFLGLKNFISPLFCWTVAKIKTATHTPIFVWMNCADDGCWKNTSHMMQNLTMYCFNKILRSKCGWHVYTSTYWFRSMCWHGSLFSRQKKTTFASSTSEIIIYK